MVGKVKRGYGLWSGEGVPIVVIGARVLWRAAFFFPRDHFGD